MIFWQSKAPSGLDPEKIGYLKQYFKELVKFAISFIQKIFIIIYISILLVKCFYPTFYIFSLKKQHFEVRW